MFDVVRQTIRVFKIPGHSVEFTTHRLDWGTSRDLADVTERHITRLGQRLHRGVWFLCPKFTVYSATPSADFFRAAREARSHWLMQTRRVMGKGDPQRRKRKAEREGRRAAYLELMQTVVEGGPPDRPPEVINLSVLPTDQRMAVHLGGMLAKELAFTGLGIIDGCPVDPITWNRMADKLIPPRLTPTTTVTRRPVDLAAPEASGDPGPSMPVNNHRKQPVGGV